MANWITHTILANRLLARGLNIDEKGFIVGNIAPDCNQENEDWSIFTPPRDVTHWMTGGSKSSADYQAFFNAHIAGRQFPDSQEYAFLLGYYTHLVTDACYQNFVRNPDRVAACFSRLKAEHHTAGQITGRPETFDTLKSIFGRKVLFQDIAILENNWVFTHPNSVYDRVLRKTTSFPDYLPLFPKGAYPRKIAIMTGEATQLYPEYNLCFFTKEEWHGFLDDTEELLVQLLKEKASV